jgi:citrate lyase beta subunit
LYVPGDRPERFDKAVAAGADAVICDLEDAVGPDRKDQARQAVANWLTTEHRAYVRINSADTEWHTDDLAAVAAAPGLLGVILPKTDAAVQIGATAAVLPATVPVLPLVESAAGVQHAAEIAAAPRVAALLFGSVDFSLDIGTDGADADDPDQTAMLYARSHLVIASRAAGITPPVDGVTVDLDDPDAVKVDAGRARRLGFGGKQCIHPRQIAAVNAAFAASEAQLEWARRVVEAADLAHGAALRLDGQMIDKPRITQARRLLDTAQARVGS